jgi:hypothetical protein
MLALRTHSKLCDSNVHDCLDNDELCHEPPSPAKINPFVNLIHLTDC